MTIVNDDSRVISNQSFKLSDDPRVVIYDRHRVIIQATGRSNTCKYDNNLRKCEHPTLLQVRLKGVARYNHSSLPGSNVIKLCTFVINICCK